MVKEMAQGKQITAGNVETVIVGGYNLPETDIDNTD